MGSIQKFAVGRAGTFDACSRNRDIRKRYRTAARAGDCCVTDSREVCERINLGYRDPASIDVESFADREDEGVLLVRKAGEHLYRLHDE